MAASLVIAIVSLVLAAASSAFTMVAWWRSGSLVRVDSVEGYVMPRGGAVDLDQDLPVPDPVFVADDEHALTRIYRVVNVGRQPIALLDWWIDYGGEERQGIFVPDAGTQATGRPVTTLEPGHLVQLAIPHRMLRSWKPDASRSELQQDPRLVVELGTGKRRRSTRLPCADPVVLDA